jgi:hypothetical protein
MTNYPETLPSATPATHGEVLDELRAMAAVKGLSVLYGSGLWYAPTQAAAISSQTNSVGNLRLFREDFPPGTTLEGLAINVVTQGAAGARKVLVVYEDDGESSYPGALQYETAELDCETNGAKSEEFDAIAVGGTRWIGTLTLGATCVCSGISSGRRGVGVDTLASINVPWTGYIETGAAEAPAEFTATRTPINGLDRVFYKIG